MVPRVNLRRLQLFCVLLACVLAGTLLCPAQSDSSLTLQAQDIPAPQTAPTSSAADEPQQKSEDKKNKKEKKKKPGSFVIAPLPIVSPAIGSGIIPVVGYITPIPAHEHKETPSVFGVAGLITNNGSRGFAVGTDLYFKQAKYELTSGYVHGSLDYNLYGEGYINGNLGLKLPLEQTGQAFFIKFLREIGWGTYIGARFLTGSSFITLKQASGNLPPIPPDVGLHTSLRALGAEIYRDTRPNRFYPVKGTLLDFTADVFAEPLGSKYSFQSYRFTFNKYASLPFNQVLAYNLYYCGTGGSPPFYGECLYGTNNELRGYTAGRYIDKQMFATQLEDRLSLPWRLGIVAFVGIGAVSPGASAWRANQFLPAGGVGGRFMLSKDYHVNLRTDFAWGKDNFTWAVGVGEAF